MCGLCAELSQFVHVSVQLPTNTKVFLNVQSVILVSIDLHNEFENEMYIKAVFFRY